jgi:predicted peroxiredoxin
MAADDKLVIGQTHGADDAESVLIGYLLGVEALRAGKEVVMCLIKGGVQIATEGYSDALQCQERPPSRTFMPSTSKRVDVSSPALSV